MKKIISLFKRNYDGDRKVYDAVTEGADWVTAGEGVATRKWDGVAVLIENGKIFKRYDAKKGRIPPDSFKPAQPEPDPVTGHWPGWVSADGPEGKYIREAVNNHDGYLPDGTYEVCGPKIGTRHGPNPEHLNQHVIIPHGNDVLVDCPRDYGGIMSYLENLSIEGIVWHHPDGRMVKIKKADFPYAKNKK